LAQASLEHCFGSGELGALLWLRRAWTRRWARRLSHDRDEAVGGGLKHRLAQRNKHRKLQRPQGSPARGFMS